MIARIRRLYDAMNADDLDAVTEMGDPDIVLVRVGGQGELHGTSAIRDWLKPDAFESQVLEPLDFEVAGDRVLARVRSRVRGAGSGIELEIIAWSVFTFSQEGKISRAELFLEHEEDEARRALGGE